MRLRNLLKFNKRVKELPQYTPKSDLPRATKEMKARNIKELFGKKEEFNWFTGGGFEKDKSLKEKDKVYYRKKLAEKEKRMGEKSPFRLEKDKSRKMDWIDRDDKICRDMERAGHRKDKRELGGWLKAFAKEDARELKRFEREMARD